MLELIGSWVLVLDFFSRQKQRLYPVPHCDPFIFFMRLKEGIIKFNRATEDLKFSEGLVRFLNTKMF